MVTIKRLPENFYMGRQEGSELRVRQRLTLILAAVIIFVLGINVGNGRLAIDLHHGNKPVATGLPAKLDYSSINQVYQSLKDNYDGQLTEKQLIDGMKHGLAESTKDPYTVYFNAKEAKDFVNQLNNSFAGIGARLSKDSDGNLVIAEPLKGYPAEQAGLKAQDIIISVDGKDVTRLTLDDAISKIRGPEGTKVKIEVVRDKAQQLTFTVTRQKIQLPSVNTKMLDGNVGYIQIVSFSDDTAKLAQQAADDFASKHVKGIVLDLRDDPGGYLDAAVKVSSLWLPEGQTILQEKRGKEVVNEYRAQGGNELNGIPTVVLINGGSASASEITTGALHDNKAAYVIGEKSYGKGVVQQTICITGQRNSDGTCPADMLKVTVASWFRPNGQNINKKGITPDQVVKLSPEDIKAGNDVQLKAAQDYLSKH